jgi:hypothetical protein
MVGELQVRWDIRADGDAGDSSEGWPPGNVRIRCDSIATAGLCVSFASILNATPRPRAPNTTLEIHGAPALKK